MIPRPPMEEFDLNRAIEVWKSPSTNDLEDIRSALSVVRYYHANAVDLVRRTEKSKPAYLDLKADEEILEVYLTDLKDALIAMMHQNKMAGGF